MVRIVGINGSTRKGSNTLKTLKIALKAAEEAGAEIDIIDLREWKLPIFVDGEQEEEIVQRFRGKIMAADGIILASPEYHGTLSGALKNALDYLGREEIEHKAIGTLATSGSKFGADRTLAALQQVGQKLRGWPIKTQGSVPSASSFFNEEEFTDQRLKERIQQVGKETTFLARQLVNTTIYS